MNTEPILSLPPISPASGAPLYQQIIDALTREIVEGRLAAGAPLPSFRALAEQMLVSLITVKRAYEELERDGLICRRQGLGTFVATDGPARARAAGQARARERLRDALLEAAHAGMTRTELLALTRQTLDRQGEDSA